MRSYAKLLISFPLLISGGLAAQEGRWTLPQGDPPQAERGVPLRDVEQSRGPSWAPGNAEARAYARETGQSIGEATSEMRKINALNQFIVRLEARRPGLFSFVSMRGGNLVIGLTDPTIELSDILPPGLIGSQFVKAAMSAEDAEREATTLSDRLKNSGFDDVTVGVAAETGEVTILAGDQEAEIRAAIKSGKVSVEGPYRVESGKIVTTGTLYGSAAWETDPTRCPDLCGGTTGFSLMSTGSDATRYVTTAGHIYNGNGRFNSKVDGTYTSSGYVSLGSTIDLLPNRLDIQLAPPTNPTSNPPGPYIWDGYQYVTIKGAIYPIGGILMCKFGRYTGPNCGGLTEDPVRTYSNSKYGLSNLYMIVKPSNVSINNWNRKGDSGGPVWRGDWAAGWSHGHHETTGNFYYTSIRDLRTSGLPYDLIVAP